ncbi:hypothetical protein [Persicobacter diffluens]
MTLSRFFSLLFLCLTQFAYAQSGRMSKKGYAYHTSPRSPFKINLTVGLNTYYGEFGKPYQPAAQNNYLNPRLGVGLEYDISNRFNLRLDGSYFNLQLSQINNQANEIKVNTSGWDAWVGFNQHIFNNLQHLKSRRYFSLYFFAGIGYMSYTPKRTVNGEQEIIRKEDGAPINLPVGTIMFPLGGGITYNINDIWKISGEAGIRISSTDLIDGREQESRLPDLLLPLTLKISYRLQGLGKSDYLYKRYRQDRLNGK